MKERHIFPGVSQRIFILFSYSSLKIWKGKCPTSQLTVIAGGKNGNKEEDSFNRVWFTR